MIRGMLNETDLSAYFARIGYAGPHEPTLGTLREIAFAHATSIPFENLDVLLGRGVKLGPADLIDKLVHRRRGGYCFEHNSLLLGALRALGFDAEGLAARVVWNQAPDRLPPRTHMLLRVNLPEGVFLADAGFGGLTLTAPLRLEAGPEQATPHELHRLVADGDELELQASLDGDWARLYRFAPIPQLAIDYEMANWFTSTYPASLFAENLLMARPEPDRRYALFNRDFTVRHRGGQIERRALENAADLYEVLTRDFRVGSFDISEAAAIWERLAPKS